jgi:hypothetical protein
MYPTGLLALCLSLTAAHPPGDEPAKKPTKFAAKDAHKPTPLPDRVILTWDGDPATTMAVTWRTDGSVEKGLAQLARSEAGNAFDNMNARRKKDDPAAPERPDPKKVKTLTAFTVDHDTDLGPSHRHTVSFTGLSPDTRYVYRVGDGANWSEWFEFRTASDKPAPVRFLYFGDAQNEIKSHWSRVVRGAFADMPKAHFLLHAGDLINRAESDEEWGEWFAAPGWINGHIPTVATPGNHEYRRVNGKPTVSSHWRASFRFPENGPDGLEETCYFTDIQGVRVVSLNSNEQHEAQAKWLDKVLADNPNKWTVITFHHPVYSTAASRQKDEEGKAVRVHWRPVFDKYAVDIVLAGHDHTYGRSKLMASDNVLDGARVQGAKGTVYCVSVSGPKMYELGAQKWMAKSGENVQLYQLITIDGGKLSYEARTADGKPFDGFELVKRPGKGNELIEKPVGKPAAAPVPATAGR